MFLIQLLLQVNSIISAQYKQTTLIGTGTPEAGGLQTRELLHCIRLLNDMNHVGGDVVEVAPCYDHAEITSLAATKVLYEILTVGLKNRT